jgi:simple sugar transport system substrate-binding protein
MLKRLIVLASGLLLVLSIAAPAMAQNGKTFFWISHGSPADPVWTYFLQGVKQWEQDTGNTVNTSFHSNDVATHQEAFRSAIAANPAGIVSSVPDPGSLNEVVAEAKAKGIPVININTPDPTAGFDAYVGTNNVEVGRRWAQYLVDGGHVKAGDFVWMPVEVPGAVYGVQETEGVASVFDPLGITYEVQDTKYEQGELLSSMVDYLTANRDKIDAMIGLGDLVTGSVARVWEQVGVKAGDIPVVGWGNSTDTAQEILDGYVLAGMWQDPQLTSYVGLSLAAAEASGYPVAFDVLVGALYEKDTAQTYLDILSAK